jgi:uncharacterized protein YndB with AHSA1/START domain
MKIVWFILGGLACLIVLVALSVNLVGLFIPVNHQSSVSVILDADQKKVWTVITDYQSLPSWWSTVKSIEKQEKDGKELWINTDQHGQKVAFYTTEEEAPNKLVRTMLSDNLPFGGSWTYELVTQDGKTHLTITEKGFIRSAFIRTIAKLFMNDQETMQSYVTSLQKKLNQ